jgi:hypothetical protein
MQSSSIIFGSRPWPSLTSESTGLIRPDVADARKCAIAPAIVGDFLDQQCGIPTARAGGPAATLTDRKPRAGCGCYLTSLSRGRRRWPCGDFGSCDLSAGASSGNIASHKAFNSESATRLSFIRSSRIATDTNRAVSRLPLSMRTARHSSRVARTECNRSSELATSVVSVTELAR